jgi:predicted RNA-binding Zn-ribbon protein involved in translation (DUF1610 family)
MEFTLESELDVPKLDALELDDALKLNEVPELDNTLELDDMPESEELLVPDSLPPASETTVPDSLLPASETTVPDSLLPASETTVPDSLLPASETTVPDSLPPGAFLCAHCHLVHEDRDSWNRAHLVLYPCVRCGFVHMDYWLSSPLRRDEFDCTAALDVKHEMEQMQQSWRNMNIK